MSSAGMALVAAASFMLLSLKPLAAAPAMGSTVIDTATSSDRRLRPRFMQSFDMMTLQGLDDGGSSDVFATTRTSVPGHQRKISC